MPVAALPDTSLFYEIDGRGFPVLVLPGIGLDHVVYRRTLSTLTGVVRLVHLDHRGNGRSAAADPASISIERFADDAVALADLLGLDRFAVLGHSYGGFVAQELALRHPHRVAALILASTTPGQLGTGESPDDEQGPPPPAEVGRLMSSMPSTDDELAELMSALLPFYFHRTRIDDARAAFKGTRFRVETMGPGYAALGGWSSVDRLASITAPTFVLAGRHDVFTSYPQAHRIARHVPGAEVVVFDHSGHFPWIDEPETFAATARGWLTSTLPSP